MAEKDLTEKLLEDYNEVFADIVNVLLFNGEQRINPTELINTSVHSQYKSDDTKLHEQERDVVKRWNKFGVEIAICGIENQTKPEKLMPIRVIGYDGASYRQQLNDKITKPIPVITLVLYFGTDSRWTQPRTLKGLMDVPSEFEEYVNDYRINLFEIAWLSDDTISKFKSDFKVVANFFSKKRQNRDYVPDDLTEITHVNEVLKLLKVMTGDARYEEILINSKEVKTMCDVAERLENKGAAKMLYELVESGDLAPEKAAEKLGITVEQLKKEMAENNRIML